MPRRNLEPLPAILLRSARIRPPPAASTRQPADEIQPTPSTTTPSTLELEHHHRTHTRADMQHADSHEPTDAGSSSSSAAPPAHPAAPAASSSSPASLARQLQADATSSPPTPLFLPKRGGNMPASSGTSSVDASGANTPNSLLSPLVVHRSGQSAAGGAGKRAADLSGRTSAGAHSAW